MSSGTPVLDSLMATDLDWVRKTGKRSPLWLSHCGGSKDCDKVKIPPSSHMCNLDREQPHVPHALVDLPPVKMITAPNSFSIDGETKRQVTQPMSDLTCTSLGTPITMQAGTVYLNSQAAVVPREQAIADLLLSSDTARLRQR